MSKAGGILEVVAGVAALAGAVALTAFSGGALAPVAVFLGSSLGPVASVLGNAGAGLLLAGAGSLAAGDPISGFATATRNSIQPWSVSYGRTRPKAATVYLHYWGTNNQVLDMVFVLSAHSSQSLDEVLFDQQRVQIDTSAAPAGAAAGSGTSFTPVQQTINITSIVRSSDVVTVSLPANIPFLTAGDNIGIENVTSDPSLNGTFQVAAIVSQVFGGPGSIVFTYLCGGAAVSIASQGQALTKWADYGRDVYVEPLLGGQTLGQTFKGMTSGTPWQGNGPLVRPELPGPAGAAVNPDNIFGGTLNPWTRFCSLQGKTAVFVRITYAQKYFQAGLPQISFHLRGKNDIYDPRLGAFGSPGTTAYTENPALCIADHLANQTWGFKAQYGLDIPLTELAAAADACDATVALAAGGTEPRYTCNGWFELTKTRGQVLQDLLTSCAGRLDPTGGRYVLQPGYWVGPGSPPLRIDLTAIAAGPARWSPTASIRELFNGAKGTYISPANKWQSTDIPAYAQDSLHGYSGPSMYGGDINLAFDGGERRWFDMHLPFTTSASMAQRILKIELLRRRNSGAGTFPLNMAGYQLQNLDIFEADCAVLGWSAKVLEVAAVRLTANKQSSGDQEVICLGTEVDVRETDSDIYVWSTSEELSAQGYVQGNFPTGHAPEPACWPWSPGYVAPLAGDAVYPEGATGPGNFGLQPVYDFEAGEGTVSVQIKGTPPINALDTAVANPQISCVGSVGGGFLPAGTYVVGASAFDSGSASHANTDYLNLSVVEVGGSGSGSIGVTVAWGSGDDGGDLYVALWKPEGGYIFHRNQTLTPGQTTATITAFDQSTAGGPDRLFDHLGIAILPEIHGGVWAQQVQAVTATTITIGGDSMTVDQWAGYTLSLLAKFDPTVEIAVLNMPVASSTASSGSPPQFVLTIGPNSASVQLPDLTTLLQKGDLLVMRDNPTFTDSSFTDPQIANPYYPSGATDVETGHVAVVLSGPDTGDVQTIGGVTTDGFGNSTVFNLSGNWKITPNAGDLVVICEAANAPELVSPAIRARNGSVSGVMAQPKIANLNQQAWLILVRTEDVNGASGPDLYAPMRDVAFFETQGTRFVTASE